MITEKDLPKWEKIDPLAKRWKLKYDDIVAIVYRTVKINESYSWRLKHRGKIVEEGMGNNSLHSTMATAKTKLVEYYNRFMFEEEQKFSAW